jgi:hypothetical protein
MALRTLGAKAAAALDQELMSTGAFSLDQLMELAGLSVSQALFKLQPPSCGNRVLIAVGPGNNGGDGLVAARHLWHYGYKPTVYYPKRPKNELYQVSKERGKELGHDTDEATSASHHPTPRPPHPIYVRLPLPTLPNRFHHRLHLRLLLRRPSPRTVSFCHLRPRHHKNPSLGSRCPE